MDDYLLDDGGLVLIYRVTNMALGEFYIASFDDQDDEVPWGLGLTAEDALKNAEAEWDKYNHDEGPDQNPFTQVLKQVKS